MVDRRKSDEYRQLTAYIPKDLYKKFKSVLVFKEIPQNDAVAAAIEKWLEDQEGEENT